MSATKELRKLLEQRGVSWMPSAWSSRYETYYQTDNGVGVVASELNGKIAVRLESRITPEQAVEATIGHESDGEMFICRSCKVAYELNIIDKSYGKSRFCPNCGSRLVYS